jgi:hypothetical protein
VSRSSEAVPTTPFKGVRISWLMVARNADFAWWPASRSVMSVNVRTTPPPSSGMVRVSSMTPFGRWYW